MTFGESTCVLWLDFKNFDEHRPNSMYDEEVKFVIKLFIAMIVIPALLGGTFYQLDKHGFFNLERIEIVLDDQDHKPLYLKPLIAQLDQRLQNFRGQSLWSLDLRHISAELEKMNWIQEHSLTRSWPQRLVLKVRPQQVKALLLTPQRQLRPVIASGDVMDKIEFNLAPDVAVLTSASFNTNSTLRQQALQVIEELPAEGSFSQSTISEVEWDQKLGFTAKMTRSGLAVRLGEDQISIKAARVNEVIDYLESRGLHAEILDANLSKKVLVKLQNTNEFVTQQ